MNNRLETIHNAFPFFQQGSFYMVTPDEHFDDPNNEIQIQVWGDKYKTIFSGPGEYDEEIHDTAEEVIQSVREWLEAYEASKK